MEWIFTLPFEQRRTENCGQQYCGTSGTRLWKQSVIAYRVYVAVLSIMELGSLFSNKNRFMR